MCYYNFLFPSLMLITSQEEKNKEFIKIQEAYDIMMDPLRRRKYDSSRPFDDDIPKEAELESKKSMVADEMGFDDVGSALDAAEMEEQKSLSRRRNCHKHNH